MSIGATPQVSRRIAPAPQTLAELGDKKQVLEFLMAEYLHIHDFQCIDAPVLVNFLLGDDAARSSCISDSFRNAFAMRELERLWTDISREVVHESEVAGYQARYDRIAKDADLTAVAYEGCAREWRKGPARQELPPEQTHKVALGDSWRSKRHGRALRVICVNTIRREAVLESSGRDGRPRIELVMQLDENGFCLEPEGNWLLFAHQDKAPLPKVALCQRWMRRPGTSGESVGRVSHLSKDHCVLSFDGPTPEQRFTEDYKLDGDGRFKHQDGWKLVSDGEAERQIVDHHRRMCEAKVEIAQTWVRIRNGEADGVGVVTMLDDGAALLTTAEPGHLLRMPLTQNGYCRDIHEWARQLPPFPLNQGGYEIAPSKLAAEPAAVAPKVEYGQLWYQKLLGGGRQGKVISSHRKNAAGDTYVTLEGHVDMFAMPLDPDGRPLHPAEWSLVREAMR